MQRRYLEERGETFEERDITTDAEAEKEVASTTGGPLWVPSRSRMAKCASAFPIPEAERGAGRAGSGSTARAEGARDVPSAVPLTVR